MRAPRWLLVVALVALSQTAVMAELDPRQVDFLGLRLGMRLPSVVAVVSAQGFGGQRLQQDDAPCPTDPSARCVTLLTSATKDGVLRIRFVAPAGPGSETAWSIAYTLAGRGVGEPDVIRATVLNRFGPPSGHDPLVWCAGTGSAGCNGADQPRLTYQEGPDTSSTVTLIDPGALHAAH